MTLTVIPAAVPLKKELREVFGDISGVLVPIDGIPLIDLIVGNSSSDRFVIITNEQHFAAVSEYVAEKYENVLAATVESTKDLAETIIVGIDFANITPGGGADVPSPTNIIVNFGDTYIKNILFPNADYCVFSHENETVLWTSFAQTNGIITDIYDKVDTTDVPSDVFVGLFGFSDAEYITKLLRTKKSFYAALQEYSQKQPLTFLKTNSGNWIDVGHIDRYYLAKKTVGARYFNSVKVDIKRGIIIKRSEDKAKLSREIEWYLKLPRTLRYLTPNIYDYSADAENPFVKMEYYSYPTLHEILIWGNLSFPAWEGICENLLFTLSEMQSYRIDCTHGEFEMAVREMYVTKTMERFHKLAKNLDIDSDIIVNGKNCGNIAGVIDNLEIVLHSSEIFDRDILSVVHGDFCASNILLDTRNNILRLIDPRGSFGKFDIYGDPLYDIAKLLHSFDGGYDFLISDRFKLEKENGEYRFEINCNDKQLEIRELIINAISQKYADSFFQARLIESLLFLSMLPLHADKPKRCEAFLCTGIKLFAESLEHFLIKRAER
jgi:hypothetical protein